MVDRTIVDQKFEMWRKTQEIALLRDKTIFAYHYFKLNNEPLKLKWMQDCIISDPHKRILFCACNQHLGKSTTLDTDAATEFLKDHGKGWIGLLVSGSLDQSEQRMRNIKALIRTSGIEYKEEDTTDTKTGKVDNATKISFTFYGTDGKPMYTNLLICCPHTSSALGYPADDIWLDEFDFWQDVRGGQRHFLYQIIIPRTFQTKGRIKIYSNPNGKSGLFYELWNQKDKNGDFVWHRYQFNYWDKDGATQEEFDRISEGMTRFEIDSTLLAVFSQAEGAFLSHEEIHDQLDPELQQKGDAAGEGRETAWFLDVGTVHDQSVLSGGYVKENKEVPDIPLIDVFYVHKYPVGYPLARVIGVDSAIDREDGWDEYTEDNPSIKSVLANYALEFNGKKEQPLFGYDATGNPGLAPLFASVNIDAVDIIFAGKRKWEMYQRLQYYAQKRFLKRCKDRDFNMVRNSDCSYQMARLVVKKTQNKSYRQVHHESEDDLDDCPDSIAGLIHLIENPNLPTLSFDIINAEGKSIKEEVLKEAEEEKIKNLSQEAQEKLKGQYVPSFMRNSEFYSFVERKESEYR